MDSDSVFPTEGPGLINHIMESLFFSMSVYEPTQDAVLQDLHRRVGKVQPLMDYGFDEDGKQAIFVARSQSGRIIVSCRGTAGFRDVVQDLKYLQSRLSFMKGAAHWGFAERAESVPIDFFCKLLDAGEEVIFTGHSLGGAVASLLCLRVLESSKGKFDEQVHCITFGCPLFASCRLAELINSNYKDVFIHIVSRRDVVPKILPFVSTLQKLVYADEDHLEGLFVLRKILEFLPGIPLAAIITGVERRIPSLFKFLFRCFMKLALPSGMTGSYAFAGHIVMLDSDAAVDRSLMLSTADEMNVWHSQLGFAFGSGFDVAMIEEHMLDCYHNGIVRAFSQVRLKRELGNSVPTSRPPIWVDGKLQQQQQSIIIRLVPQNASTESMGCEIQVRCDSNKAGSPSIFVMQNSAALQQQDGKDLGLHHSKLETDACGMERCEACIGSSTPLMRTRSVGDQIFVLSKSKSWKLERSTSMSNHSNSKGRHAVWGSRSERRDGVLVRSKERSIRCRACSHLQVHMNIDACCHRARRNGFELAWVLGTIGRVARHLRILDNLCYLTFIRIVVGNLVG